MSASPRQRRTRSRREEQNEKHEVPADQIREELAALGVPFSNADDDQDRELGSLFDKR